MPRGYRLDTPHHNGPCSVGWHDTDCSRTRRILAGWRATCRAAAVKACHRPHRGHPPEACEPQALGSVLPKKLGSHSAICLALSWATPVPRVPSRLVAVFALPSHLHSLPPVLPTITGQGRVAPRTERGPAGGAVNDGPALVRIAVQAERRPAGRRGIGDRTPGGRACPPSRLLIGPDDLLEPFLVPARLRGATGKLVRMMPPDQSQKGAPDLPLSAARGNPQDPPGVARRRHLLHPPCPVFSF